MVAFIILLRRKKTLIFVEYSHLIRQLKRNKPFVEHSFNSAS